MPLGRDSDTAVTASTLAGPRARAAAASTREESTPPENATRTREYRRNQASSAVAAESVLTESAWAVSARSGPTRRLWHDDEVTRPGSDIRLDIDRLRRTGDPEVVLALHKTPEQTVASLRGLSKAHPDRAVLATRCDGATRAECQGAFPGAWIDDVARTVAVGPLPQPHGTVTVVTAGTSDLRVAREAVVTTQVFGGSAVLVADVGVAGLHRLLAELDTLAAADAIVAVAGADGAMPGVIAGLVS